ncbi:MAG: Holliday junction branch migration protein RuvA, partial [Bacillota bacterium]
LHTLPDLQQEVIMYTYLHIREDELSLYGFLDITEREFFITLLQVSGIGPKLALNILSKLNVNELRRTIVMGDAGPLTGISGVGKKTAQRIILELKDKLGKEQIVEQAFSPSVNDNVRSQTVSALVALGYSLAEAQSAVPSLDSLSQKNPSVEDLLRIALKTLAKY